MLHPSGSSVDVDAVVQRTASCRSVARLAAGRFGEVATYLPGRRIPGVRVADGRVEVHVVARWNVPVPELAAEVRQAVRPWTGDLTVDVHVDDVEVATGSDGTPLYLPETS
jgi:uncharacterized alkaline shock family protein YloU